MAHSEELPKHEKAAKLFADHLPRVLEDKAVTPELAERKKFRYHLKKGWFKNLLLGAGAGLALGGLGVPFAILIFPNLLAGGLALNGVAAGAGLAGGYLGRARWQQRRDPGKVAAEAHELLLEKYHRNPRFKTVVDDWVHNQHELEKFEALALTDEEHRLLNMLPTVRQTIRDLKDNVTKDSLIQPEAGENLEVPIDGRVSEGNARRALRGMVGNQKILEEMKKEVETRSWEHEGQKQRIKELLDREVKRQKLLDTLRRTATIIKDESTPIISDRVFSVYKKETKQAGERVRDTLIEALNRERIVNAVTGLVHEKGQQEGEGEGGHH